MNTDLIGEQTSERRNEHRNVFRNTHRAIIASANEHRIGRGPKSLRPMDKYDFFLTFILRVCDFGKNKKPCKK